MRSPVYIWPLSHPKNRFFCSTIVYSCCTWSGLLLSKFFWFLGRDKGHIYGTSHLFYFTYLYIWSINVIYRVALFWKILFKIAFFHSIKRLRSIIIFPRDNMILWQLGGVFMVLPYQYATRYDEGDMVCIILSITLYTIMKILQLLILTSLRLVWLHVSIVFNSRSNSRWCKDGDTWNFLLSY